MQPSQPHCRVRWPPMGTSGFEAESRYSPLNNGESVISNPSARISTDLRQGSFFPCSKSDMNGLPRPVWTAK
jgi:hypothetical protein